MAVDAQSATSTGHAYGAALVINEGQQTAFRTMFGGYARITGSTQLWSERGEMMPGVARYDRLIPFFPPVMVDQATTVHPILIRGGRDFILDLIIYDDDGLVRNITGAVFIAQVRKYRYAKYSVAQMGYEIVDAPNGLLRLRLTPDVTSQMVRCMMVGVWDLEMQLGGVESTVIPESRVRVLPGISQGTLVSGQTAMGVGVANNNA